MYHNASKFQQAKMILQSKQTLRRCDPKVSNGHIKSSPDSLRGREDEQALALYKVT